MDFDQFVLAAATGDLADESTARPHADALEFRMDLAEDPVEQLEQYNGALPIIATNRPTWEGGGRPDGTERIEELQKALEFEAVEAVDVELGALTDTDDAEGDGKPVIRTAVENDRSVIVSYHDFETTPDLSDLADLASQVCTVGDLGKIAVTAETRGSVLDLLRVTHEFSAAGQSIATMAMGQIGKHSRIVTPLYGSKLGYAPVDPEEATAPGQYELQTMGSLIDQLQ